MKLSFKQFSSIVDASEQLTEEQLDEILGLDKLKQAILTITDPVKRQQELEKLEKERIAAASAAFNKRKELRAKQVAPKIPGKANIGIKDYDRSERTANRGSGLRAAERDWISGLSA